MKSPRYCPPQLLKIGNRNLSTPWGRYRHGSDPPDIREIPKNRFIDLPSTVEFCLTNQSYPLRPTNSPIPEHHLGSPISLVR
ncbi:MAG: hypothetical protein R3B74_10300, partial [Nitrospirales bacterium]|nr:hypothetical protein [Nitrospirales bacterium]